MANPTLSNPTIASNGITFTATLSTLGCIPTTSTGHFTLGGTATTVTDWTISDTTLTITHAGVIRQSETITLSYTRLNDSTDIVDGSANPLLNIVSIAVINNSTVKETNPTSNFAKNQISIRRETHTTPANRIWNRREIFYTPE
jgi:hypothetical protein